MQYENLTKLQWKELGILKLAENTLQLPASWSEIKFTLIDRSYYVALSSTMTKETFDSLIALMNKRIDFVIGGQYQNVNSYGGAYVRFSDTDVVYGSYAWNGEVRTQYADIYVEYK